MAYERKQVVPTYVRLKISGFVCAARAMGMTETATTESSYSTIASPMAGRTQPYLEHLLTMVVFLFAWLLHAHISTTDEFLCLPPEYCSTDFSQVSYEDVKAACPADANQGANPACCAAFNNKACQYESQVNNFGSMCPMLFINYLGAAGPYPAGYFVGPCVDGSKGFCIRH